MAHTLIGNVAGLPFYSDDKEIATVEDAEAKGFATKVSGDISWLASKSITATKAVLVKGAIYTLGANIEDDPRLPTMADRV